jgi:hypothetical protein
VVVKQFIFNWNHGRGTRNKLQEHGIREGQRKSSTAIRERDNYRSSRKTGQRQKDHLPGGIRNRMEAKKGSYTTTVEVLGEGKRTAC